MEFIRERLEVWKVEVAIMRMLIALLLGPVAVSFAQFSSAVSLSNGVQLSEARPQLFWKLNSSRPQVTAFITSFGTRTI